MHAKKILAMACMGAVLVSSATGCSITPKKETKTETKTIEPVTIATETPTPTVIQEESIGEKETSLKDVQVSIEKTGKKGNVNLQITNNSDTKDISQSFTASTSAFISNDDSGNGIYSGSDSVMYEQENSWKEVDGSYENIFDLIYSSDCEKKEDTVIDNNACYHISLDTDDDIGVLEAYCYMNGYTDLVCGSTHFDFYINLETKQFVRVDMSMEFMATAADSTDTKGEISGSIFVSDSSTDEISKPEATKAESESASSDYTPGEILEDKNSYQNQRFGIQILGQNLFTFDSSKTDELKSSYTESGSRYQEEAYGSGDGVIINISSIASNGSSTETIMNQYLTDSSAQDITSGDSIKLAGNTYATATSTINSTQTKTYGTGVDGQVLIITVYYTDASSIETFETKNVFTTSENPYWEAENWTLESKYTVTTPSGYSIEKSESGDLYVDMKSSTDEINVFAIENSTVDTEREKETQSEGNTTRVVKGEESVTLTDGTEMKYLVIFNTEPNLTYYTYIGLVQKDSAVIKFYAVSTAGTADYKNVYSEIANSVVVQSTDTTSTDSTDSTQTLTEGTVEGSVDTTDATVQ